MLERKGDTLGCIHRTTFLDHVSPYLISTICFRMKLIFLQFIRYPKKNEHARCESHHEPGDVDGSVAFVLRGLAHRSLDVIDKHILIVYRLEIPDDPGTEQFQH